MAIIHDITPQRIAARAAVIFGKPYQDLHLRRMLQVLTPFQWECIIDMECLAELELLRATGQVEQQTEGCGLLEDQ